MSSLGYLEVFLRLGAAVLAGAVILRQLWPTTYELPPTSYRLQASQTRARCGRI